VTVRRLTDNSRGRDNRWICLNLREIRAAVAAATQFIAALQQSALITQSEGLKLAWSSGAEFHANPHIGTPDNVTRLSGLIEGNDQHEVIRDADLACHFKAGSGRGHVTDAAVNAGRAIECDRAALERA
jgi:hypothetical protein